MFKKLFFNILITISILGLIFNCQEENDEVEDTIEKLKLINPKTESDYCNKMPILEWTPVKYADRYQIFIDEILIDVVYVDPEALNDDGNYTYDFNEKEHFTNFKIKICGDNSENSNPNCPYSPISIEKDKKKIKPYTWYIRACHEFQYQPSNEKRTFTYNDC